MSDYIQDYTDMVILIANDYRKKYSMVDTEDIQQELWLWFVSHPRKFKEWQQLKIKDRDKLIAKSLRNAALKYCEKEKARILGYENVDLYYYDISVVEVFLPSIIAESYEIPSKIKDLNKGTGNTGEVNDGMNWLALRSDISGAYYKLSEAKQNVLRLRFSQENANWNELGKELNTTPDGARMKVQRAMQSLIQNLGGWRPYYDEDNKEETSTSQAAE